MSDQHDEPDSGSYCMSETGSSSMFTVDLFAVNHEVCEETALKGRDGWQTGS